MTSKLNYRTIFFWLEINQEIEIKFTNLKRIFETNKLKWQEENTFFPINPLPIFQQLTFEN